MSTLFNKEATKMTMDEIRTVLKRRKAATVAKATGLTRQTIYNIMSGRTPTPKVDTYEKLVAYLSKSRL